MGMEEGGHGGPESGRKTARAPGCRSSCEANAEASAPRRREASIGRERLPDSHVPPSPIPWKRARNQPGMYFVGNGRKIAHVANGVIRTGKNDSGSSPRAWGCFGGFMAEPFFWLVFPTCVGVFLCLTRRLRKASSLPHARGGVSYSDKVGKEVYGSSPRTRGRAWMNVLFNLAFPTRMGCFSFIRIARSAFC